MTKNAIEVRDLTITYGKKGHAVQALRGISFSVKAGERVAVIGRSGGGKSSLMRVLSGLQTPQDGEIQIRDHRLSPTQKPTRALYRDLGLVFQNYGLVGQLTALENVLCGGLRERKSLPSLFGASRTEREKAAALLCDLGLVDRIHTRASRLSGGEQQRVGIARLLFQSPPIFLLDEPVSSLDIHWANQALTTMVEKGGDHSTVVMVLHDLWMVRQFATRVIYIANGEILFDGDPDEGCQLLEASQYSIPTSTDGDLDLPPVKNGEDDPSKQTYSSEEEKTKAPESPPPLGVLDRGLMQRGPLYGAMLLGAVVLYFWAAQSVDFSIHRVVRNLGNAGDFLGRMFPPNFAVTQTITASLIETIQMALIGTTLAAILSLPLAVMAARNISARPIQAVARLLLNLLRTVPSIIWGLFFVVVVGLGPFAGVLALTFYASGYLGKFYYEGIEAIDPKPLQSLKAVGATPMQRFRWGVFPQVLPLMLGYTLYMLEYNVRAASILGIVGAGGIGFYLNTYVSFAQYQNAATALLLLLVVVTVIDSASSFLRARLMD